MSNVTIKIANGVDISADAAADIIETAAIGAILNRMEDGIGVDDEKMRDYSTAYKKHLAKIGEDTKVDHRRTGLMLSQVQVLDRQTVEVDKDGVPTKVTLTFGVGGAGNRNTIAAVQQGLRPWFGLSPKDQEMIHEALKGAAPSNPRKSTSRRSSVIVPRDSKGRFLKR